MARVLRSASWLMLSYGSGQALRLASNLILTRILFPEAFGLMALVGLVTVGLAMFSDIGLGPAVTQNPRGDDPDFLDTAWTVQVIRGFALWAGAAALALPMASFYDEPQLALYLPIAGMALAVAGFNPMRIETAYRHLLVGRLTSLELLSQFIGIAGMVVLALLTRSVMALVLGSVLQALAKLVLTQLFLPGRGNRFSWEPQAAQELVHFGKWIFLSTAFWFVSSQGDRAILGKFLTLESLGLYNIGYFLASFPYLLGLAVNQRLMMPVYRDRPAGDAPENFRKQRLLRSALTGGILVLLAVMALAGPALTGFLYDARYAASGPIVTLVACALAPAAIVMTYDQAALAAGDSRGYFLYSAARATAQVTLILAGVIHFGLAGAIVAMGLSVLMVYPVLVWLSVKHRVWDRLHDLGFGLFAGIMVLAAVRIHWQAIAAMIATTR